MSTLDKLHWIEGHSGLYEICWRVAGVALMFFELPPEYDHVQTFTTGGDAWKKWLVVHHYYPTFEAAIDAEYERLSASAG